MSQRREYGIEHDPVQPPAIVGTSFYEAKQLAALHSGRVVVRIARLSDWYPIEEEPQDLTLPIYDPITAQQVGSIMVRDSGHDQMGYIEWEILQDFRGRGLVSGMLRHHLPELLTRWHRLVALIRPQNQPSKQLATAVGFLHEGTMRQSRRLDGQWEDTELWAITTPPKLISQQPVGEFAELTR